MGLEQSVKMEKWYRQQDFYSEERLAKIYEWCEYAYKKWVTKKNRQEFQFLHLKNLVTFYNYNHIIIN